MSAQLGTESDESWLPLMDYSVRTGISLSTIRRKIKSNAIEYRLEKGRYLILFNETNNRAARQPVYSSDVGRWHDEPLSRLQAQPSVTRNEAAPREYVTTAPIQSAASLRNSEDKGVFADQAVKMVSEAFEHAVREKDQRIDLLERRNQDLEERLNELRLLVRVLEEKYEVRY